MAKGMMVSVYRNADLGDCTNGGVTSRASRVVLIGEGIPAIFDGVAGETLLLVKNGRGEFYAAPFHDTRSEHVGWMFGGNFIYSSDSRFQEAVGSSPIRVHDRQESRANYNSNFN